MDERRDVDVDVDVVRASEPGQSPEERERVVPAGDHSVVLPAICIACIGTISVY